MNKHSVDQLQRRIEVSTAPERIISLVPSQTELLHYLGLGDRVVGITKFCVHPKAWFDSKSRVGGTKKLHFDRIDDLKPDLIIANKEENNHQDIERLSEHYPVWVSDISDLEGALKMIEGISSLCNVSDRGGMLIEEITRRFDSITSAGLTTCLYLIWNGPIMVAGNDTFIDKMLKYAGFQNLVHQSRYPELSLDELKNLKPEAILLSSEPFPFKEKHTERFAALLPNSKVILVDGEMFSWYGSRLLKAPEYFQDLRSAIS